jgi:hypothetical protein
MKREIYLSTDVATDGPIPGDYSMLSLGCAAYLSDKTLLDTFEVNLEALPQAKTDPETMEWWSRQPEAWAACTKNPVPPARAMALLGEPLDALSRRKLPAAWSDGPSHPQTPLADAIEQGALFCNILHEAQERSRRTR